MGNRAATATKSWKRNKHDTRKGKKKGEMQESQQTEMNKGIGNALKRKKKNTQTRRCKGLLTEPPDTSEITARVRHSRSLPNQSGLIHGCPRNAKGSCQSGKLIRLLMFDKSH